MSRNKQRKGNAYPPMAGTTPDGGGQVEHGMSAGQSVKPKETKAGKQGKEEIAKREKKADTPKADSPAADSNTGGGKSGWDKIGDAGSSMIKTYKSKNSGE